MFHMFESEKILEILLRDVNEADEEESGRNKEILLNILYPDRNCENCFDQAIKKNSIKMIDLYLKILIKLDAVKNYRFSKYIRQHFNTIFDMDIASFYQYLGTCTF